MIDMNHLPAHVAITMDGNGRWAQKQNLPRTKGHQEGLKSGKKIIKYCSDIGLKNVTLYAFSTENWKRAEEEVGFLMNLIHIHLKGELDFYKENKIRLRHVGDITHLPEQVQKDIIETVEATKDYTGLTVNMAINYGGRDEIVRGVKKVIEKGIKSEDITESLFQDQLDFEGIPDVDLLIRTGGEKRLSNFLLWHVAYAEQIYTDILWPDYTVEDFQKDLEDFQKRHRRFGAEK